MHKNTSNSILILSCDKYRDLWKPFFQLFWKNWPDCPYQVYLGSNTVTFKDKKVKTILSGKDIDWSTSYLKILSQIPEQHILVWPEDGFILSKVDTQLINSCFTYLVQEKAKLIQTHPIILSDAKNISKNTLVGSYEKKRPYRINVKGFWDKKYLSNLLIKGEDPWHFEIIGSYRTSYEDGFYFSSKPIFNYIHIVEKGKFIRFRLKLCRENGIQLNTAVRKTQNLLEQIFSYIGMKFVYIILNINWRIRLSIMNFFRKILFSY